MEFLEVGYLQSMPKPIFRNSHRNNNNTNDFGAVRVMRVGVGYPTVTWSRGEGKLSAAPVLKTGFPQNGLSCCGT